MDTLTRRKFLIASGVVAGGALAAGATAYTLWDILATADDPGRAPGDRTLVVVTLYGGNDGLATVIPYADPAYHDARPGLSYSAEQVLRLDDDHRAQPVAEGTAPALRRQPAGDRPRRGLPGAGPQPLPLHGHLADRPTPSGPATPAGSAAGSTAWAATRGWPSRSSRCCRRCWPGNQRRRGGAGDRAQRRTGVSGRRPSPRWPNRPQASLRCRPGRPRASPTWSRSTR